jgi:hypothetical protein
MMAAVKRDMFPEFQLLFDKLNGDAVTVRDTILEAFRKSWLEGFDKLATACSMPANAPMRQRLVAVIGKLGRYRAFELQAQWELEFLARRAPAENVRKAAARALGTVQRYNDWLAFDFSPEGMSRETKRVCAMIESATTGKAAKRAESAHRPPPAPKSSRSRRCRKARTAGEVQSEPNRDEAVEQHA